MIEIMRGNKGRKKKKKKMKKGRKDHTCVEERREDLLEGENGGKMKINRA